MERECHECGGEGSYEDVYDYPSPVDGEHCQRVTFYRCEECDGGGTVEVEECDECGSGEDCEERDDLYLCAECIYEAERDEQEEATC